MTTHELKTWPELFAATLAGTKPFEVRRNDRGTRSATCYSCSNGPSPVGLRAGDGGVAISPRGFTGRAVHRRVTYILPGGRFGVDAGYCVLGLASESKP